MIVEVGTVLGAGQGGAKASEASSCSMRLQIEEASGCNGDSGCGMCVGVQHFWR